MDCNCDLCQARALNISPMEYSFRNNPIALKYVQKYPGFDGYKYEKAALEEKNCGGDWDIFFDPHYYEKNPPPPPEIDFSI